VRLVVLTAAIVVGASAQDSGFDRIKMAQEAAAREARVRARIEHQLARVGKKAEPKKSRELTDAERRELLDAIDRWLASDRREVPILWRPAK
jgi:hypothetical protein